MPESERLSSETAELGGRREALLTGQKDFFTRREELSDRQTRLDKEVFRLNSQREKLEETAGFPDGLHVGGVRADL